MAISGQSKGFTATLSNLLSGWECSCGVQEWMNERLKEHFVLHRGVTERKKRRHSDFYCNREICKSSQITKLRGDVCLLCFLLSSFFFFHLCICTMFTRLHNSPVHVCVCVCVEVKCTWLVTVVLGWEIENAVLTNSPIHCWRQITIWSASRACTHDYNYKHTSMQTSVYIYSPWTYTHTYIYVWT